MKRFDKHCCHRCGFQNILEQSQKVITKGEAESVIPISYLNIKNLSVNNGGGVPWC